MLNVCVVRNLTALVNIVNEVMAKFPTNNTFFNKKEISVKQQVSSFDSLNPKKQTKKTQANTY